MTNSAEDERAAIVAFLRGEVRTDYADPQYEIGLNLADAIERGEHHPKEDRDDG